MKMMTLVLSLILLFSGMAQATEETQSVCPQGVFFSMEEEKVWAPGDAYLFRPFLVAVQPILFMIQFVGGIITTMTSVESADHWEERYRLQLRSTFTIPFGTHCYLLRKDFPNDYPEEINSFEDYLRGG